MAVDDSGGISGILAPWLASSPWDPSTYGGAGNFGASILAAAGPSPYKVPFLVGLGKGMIAGQQNALATAKDRMGLAGNAIGIQQQMAMMPLIMARLARMSGAGAATPDSTQSTAQPVPPSASSGYVSPAPPPLLARPDDGNASSADSSAGAASAAPSGEAAPAAPRAPWMDAIDDAQFAGMLSLARGNPQGVLDASKLALEYNPAAATAMALAKDPLSVDRAAFMSAIQRGDIAGAQAARIKYLTDAKMIDTSRTGTLTLLGGLTPQGVGYSAVNPSEGTFTNGTGQSAIPGAAASKAQISGAEAGGRAANTPAVVPTAGGGSRYGYPGDIAGTPPALRAPGLSIPQPAGAPPPRSGTLTAKGSAAQGNDPWASIPKLQIPQGVGESDYFTQGKLRKAGEKDAELSGEFGNQAVLADQQLQYNVEARAALKGADTGPLSEWLTRNRASLLELGVPDGLIPKSGSVVPTLELNKALKNAALQGARSIYGSRMTQTEVKLQTDEMSPSSAMMQDAIASLMKQNDIRNIYAKQRAEDYGKYRAAGGDPMRFESWYASKFPLTSFARAASATPEQIMAEARRRGLIQ